jgi:catechol-2,3-dioxygenase
MKTAQVPEPASPDVRPSRFSHLVVKTADLAPMVAWYKTVLNAKPMYENERVCFLTYDEEHHRIMIGEAPGSPAKDPAAVGVMHWAYAFETFEQLVDAYERLRDEGIAPKSCINHGFTTSIYYPDPDGNEVELAVDNFEDTPSMNAWFAKGGFDRNFVGVPFDPEEMVKMFRDGVELGAHFAENYE